MKKNLFSCIYIGLAILLALFSKEDYLLRDISLSADLASLNNWHSAISLQHNAFFTWRLPSSLAQLIPLSFLGHYQALSAMILFCSIVFCLGLTSLLFQMSQKKNLIYPFSISLCLSLILVFVFGIERTMIPSLALLPWLCWGILGYLSSERKDNLFLFFIFLLSLLVSESANQFGLLIAGFALLFALLNDRAKQKKANALLYLALFAPQIIKLFLIPDLDFPDYPSLARVVADDGLPGNIHAFFGKEPLIQSIERIEVKKLFAVLSFVIFIFGTLVYLSLAKKGKLAKNICTLSIFLSLLVLLDTLATESFAQLMPIASFSRIIPCYLSYPLVSFFLAFSIISLFICLTYAENSLLLVLLICSTAYFSLDVPKIEDNLNYSKINKLPIAQKRILISPSLALVKREGLFVLEQKDKIKAAEFSYLPFTAKSSSDDFLNPEIILSDNNPKTRLAEMSGKQTGNEWLELRFAEDVTLDGIELSVGAFRNDFPRGLRILSAKDCKFENASPIYQTMDFQGSILYTKEGYPYYGSQSDVKIIFSSSVQTNCLRIEQTTKGVPFDWSVAEVKFASFR